MNSALDQGDRGMQSDGFDHQTGHQALDRGGAATTSVDATGIQSKKRRRDKQSAASSGLGYPSHHMQPSQSQWAPATHHASLYRSMDPIASMNRPVASMFHQDQRANEEGEASRYSQVPYLPPNFMPQPSLSPQLYSYHNPWAVGHPLYPPLEPYHNHRSSLSLLRRDQGEQRGSYWHKYVDQDQEERDPLDQYQREGAEEEEVVEHLRSKDARRHSLSSNAPPPLIPHPTHRGDQIGRQEMRRSYESELSSRERERGIRVEEEERRRLKGRATSASRRDYYSPRDERMRARGRSMRRRRYDDDYSSYDDDDDDEEEYRRYRRRRWRRRSRRSRDWSDEELSEDDDFEDDDNEDRNGLLSPKGRPNPFLVISGLPVTSLDHARRLVTSILDCYEIKVAFVKIKEVPREAEGEEEEEGEEVSVVTKIRLVDPADIKLAVKILRSTKIPELGERQRQARDQSRARLREEGGALGAGGAGGHPAAFAPLPSQKMPAAQRGQKSLAAAAAARDDFPSSSFPPSSLPPSSPSFAPLLPRPEGQVNPDLGQDHGQGQGMHHRDSSETASEAHRITHPHIHQHQQRALESDPHPLGGLGLGGGLGGVGRYGEPSSQVASEPVVAKRGRGRPRGSRGGGRGRGRGRGRSKQVDEDTSEEDDEDGGGRQMEALAYDDPNYEATHGYSQPGGRGRGKGRRGRGGRARGGGRWGGFPHPYPQQSYDPSISYPSSSQLVTGSDALVGMGYEGFNASPVYSRPRRGRPPGARGRTGSRIIPSYAREAGRGGGAIQQHPFVAHHRLQRQIQEQHNQQHQHQHNHQHQHQHQLQTHSQINSGPDSGTDWATLPGSMSLEEGGGMRGLEGGVMMRSEPQGYMGAASGRHPSPDPHAIERLLEGEELISRMEMEDWRELENARERIEQPQVTQAQPPPPSARALIASAPETLPVEGDEEGGEVAVDDDEDNGRDIEKLIQMIRVIHEILLTKDEVERMVELGMLVKEEVEGFFVFVEDKDSPSAGISGLRVMRIVDVANITNPGGEKGSAAILKVVAGETVRTVTVEDVSNEQPDCKEVGQWVSAGGVVDMEGVEVLKSKRARLLGH